MIEVVQRSKKEPYVFSIVIPTWNNLDMLKLCIAGIKTNSAYNHQLIIHVNEGSDGSLEWLKNNFSGDITFSKENAGICYPLNFCGQLVQSDYFCYFNDDMFALPNWDVPLVEAIEKRSDDLFFYSSTQIQPFDFWDNGIIANKNYGTSEKNFKKDALLNDFRSFEKEDWSGATWPPNVLPTSLWTTVGGYSIEFSPGMYSDPDLSMKLWQAGVRDFRGFGESRVYHFESKTTSRVKKNKGTITFLNKWGISSRVFGKYFLRRGAPYQGVLSEPKKTLAYKIDCLRGKIKLVFYQIFRS